jgi:hypothetical protein
VPFGTQFMKILLFLKNLYKIAGVIGYLTFKSQDIFLYLNSIEGQFFFLKSCFSLFFMEKRLSYLRNFCMWIMILPLISALHPTMSEVYKYCF